MSKLFKTIGLIFFLILISCSEYDVVKIDSNHYKPKDTLITKLDNPIEIYNYDWGDTALVNIELDNGQWVGLAKWKNVGVCSQDNILQPIQFKLNKNIIVKTKEYDTITVDSNFPQIKLHKDRFYIWFTNNKTRILREIYIDNNKVKKYKFKPGCNNVFGIDKDWNYYFSDSYGGTGDIFEKIKNDSTDKINCNLKNLPIGKFNSKLDKVNSFGRWNWFDIKEIKNLYRNNFLNYRHMLLHNNALFTVSYNYGYIEKYSLDGKFISSLNLHTISPLFNNMDKPQQVQFLDMDIVDKALFVLFGTYTKALSGIMNYPKTKKILIGIARIDISADRLKRDMIYYLLPEKHSTYLPSFEMIDANILAIPKKSSIELYRLK